MVTWTRQRGQRHRWQALGLAAMMLLAGCARPTSAGQELRVGHFPNITHAQALVGLADGTFQRALGDDVKIRPFVFNAGPGLIEALFAGEIDVAYIGPNPAINGFVKSKGQALRVVAGAASGGAVLVARADAGIADPMQIDGKTVATPQLGNTQDIALRWYAKTQEIVSARSRPFGRVTITPMSNADILTSFLRKTIDAAWVPEPWGARLVQEAGGKILLDERELWPDRQFTTAVVIASTKALQERPLLVTRWLKTHVALTRWIQAHPTEAQERINAELDRLTGKPIPPIVLREAWTRLSVTYDPLLPTLQAAGEHAQAVGFLKEAPPLKDLVDLRPLNEALTELQLTPMPSP